MTKCANSRPGKMFGGYFTDTSATDNSCGTMKSIKVFSGGGIDAKEWRWDVIKSELTLVGVGDHKR